MKNLLSIKKIILSLVIKLKKMIKDTLRQAQCDNKTNIYNNNQIVKLRQLNSKIKIKT